MMTADNAWLPRNELLASHQKMVAEVDMKEALASGQFRPLVRKEIESHCANFGLDAELVSHSRMRGLSGGQRVKVVLAACSWQRPHLIVLDEPTNYLDRDSLGALSKALKKFEGGVIIITHSAEFTKDLTEEVWAVMDGKMTPSGHNWVQGQGSGPRLKADDDDEEEKFDAMGNKIVSTKKKAKLTSSEARKKKKERMARRKRGEEVCWHCPGRVHGDELLTKRIGLQRRGRLMDVSRLKFHARFRFSSDIKSCFSGLVAWLGIVVCVSFVMFMIVIIPPQQCVHMRFYGWHWVGLACPRTGDPRMVGPKPLVGGKGGGDTCVALENRRHDRSVEIFFTLYCDGDGDMLHECMFSAVYSLVSEGTVRALPIPCER